jgi:hypothetical protein
MSAIASTSAATLADSSAVPVKPAKPDHKGFSFGDFLDIINPLQHLPVIGTLYRRLTGDEMGPTAEIAGGALFGGLIGAVSSVADVLWAQATGKDFGNTVLSWLRLDKKSDAPVQYAKAETAAETRALPQSAPAMANHEPEFPILIQAMEKQGIDPAVALRAAAAYRSAIELKMPAAPELSPAY